MGIPKSQRGQSSVQYLATALEIEVATLRLCSKAAKHYMFLLVKPTYDHARDGHDFVKKANSIFPSDAETIAMRRRYLIEAKCSYQALISRLEFMKKANIVQKADAKVWINIETKISDELLMIDGVLKSDASKKFSNLGAC